MEKRGWAIFQWASGGAAILLILMLFLLTGELQGASIVMVRTTPWMYVLFGCSVFAIYLFVLGYLARRRDALRIDLKLIVLALVWTALFFAALYIVNQL